MSHAIYKKVNGVGQIMWILNCPTRDIDVNREQLPDDLYLVQDIVTGIDGSAHYYDLVSSFLDRPEITATPNKLTILANGSDQFILTGLPEPCTVTVESATFTVTDGEFGFTTILAGAYTVTAEQFPYITKTWEVTAE